MNRASLQALRVPLLARVRFFANFVQLHFGSVCAHACKTVQIVEQGSWEIVLKSRRIVCVN